MPGIIQKFDKMAQSACDKYPFSEVGAEGRLVQSLLEAHIFLNSQTQTKGALVDMEFLNELALKGESRKIIVHYYLSYACTLGFHKSIAGGLDVNLADYMPNQEHLRPTYAFVKK